MRPRGQDSSGVTTAASHLAVGWMVVGEVGNETIEQKRRTTMANINQGDRVITTEDLGSGASKGTKGTVTQVSTFHGMATVRFDTGKEVMSVKLDYLSHA